MRDQDARELEAIYRATLHTVNKTVTSTFDRRILDLTIELQLRRAYLLGLHGAEAFEQADKEEVEK